MLQKEEVLNLITSISNEQNKEKLQKYIDLVNSMDNDAWEQFLQEHDFDTLDKLNAELEKRLNNTHTERRVEENNYPFTKLNALISYGVTGDTLHIHLIPQDVHSLLNRRGLIEAEGSLINALEQIQEIMKKGSNIKNVYAVSGIIQSLIAKMFIRLDFDVKVLAMEQSKDDVELGQFYERFKDKSDKLGRAQLSKEKLLSQEWEQLKETRKKELEEKSKRIKSQDR